MSAYVDPRITELEELAREEGIVLPMPVDMIAFLERQGRIVDLCSGTVYTNVTVATMPSAQAIAHLLCQVEGTVAI